MKYAGASPFGLPLKPEPYGICYAFASSSAMLLLGRKAKHPV